MTTDTGGLTAADLVEEGEGLTGVVHLGDTPGEQYGWECARCDGQSGLAWGDPDRARKALDEHKCVEDACPECPTGVVEAAGRPEYETGHQPYACNAGCGYYG